MSFWRENSNIVEILPEANGISIKQPQNACFSLPMYSTDKVKDIMKVPTCPAPAINLRMQKATYISAEAGSSAQAVPLPAKNRHPIAEITKVGLTQCGNSEILLSMIFLFGKISVKSTCRLISHSKDNENVN